MLTEGCAAVGRGSGRALLRRCACCLLQKCVCEREREREETPHTHTEKNCRILNTEGISPSSLFFLHTDMLKYMCTCPFDQSYKIRMDGK